MLRIILGSHFGLRGSGIANRLRGFWFPSWLPSRLIFSRTVRTSGTRSRPKSLPHSPGAQ
jgi:hypothetical protein